MTNPKQLPNTPCQVCFEAQKSPLCLDSCSHTFCKECVFGYLTCLVKEGRRRLEDFKCPKEDCQGLISEQELEREMDFEHFNKLTNKVIFESSVLCPQCRNRNDFNSNQDWVCESCATKICKFCKASDHDGKCQTVSNVAYFIEVIASVEDEELGYCPECVSPFLKDENCDHVTCQNNECSFEFCFYCSVTFSPIYNHGNYYHRPDCRNYESCEGYEPYFCEECIECSKHQSPCQPVTLCRVDFLKALIERGRGMEVQANVAVEEDIRVSDKVGEVKEVERTEEAPTQGIEERTEESAETTKETVDERVQQKVEVEAK